RQLLSSLTEIRRNAPEGAFFYGEIKERAAEMKDANRTGKIGRACRFFILYGTIQRRKGQA
ncbi:hypothetical protein, partial [Dialister invisus]